MSCTGFDGSLGIGGSGSDATLLASYTAVPNAQDINVTISADKADLSTRRSAFKQYSEALIDCEITATIVYDSSDSTISTIRTACLNRTPVLVGVFDQELTSGAGGIAFSAYVFSTDIAQPLADGQTYSVTFAPANTGTEPSWVGLS